MNAIHAAAICEILSLMKAGDAPYWQGDIAEKLNERYMSALTHPHLPDSLGPRIVAEIDRHFSVRPSVADLITWAETLIPAKVFTLLDAPAGSPPAEAKAIIENIRRELARRKSDGGLSCGLERVIPGDPTAKPSRTQPVFSEAFAASVATERNQKWPSQETRVYKTRRPQIESRR